MGKLAVVIVALLLTSAAADARHYRWHHGYYRGAGTAAAIHFQDRFKVTN
jgi:hypothetical protein